MAIEVKLPPLGENVSGGDVLEVKVQVGDQVQSGQTLIEVEAEKSSVEVPSPAAGKIAQIHVKKGEKVKTGQTVVSLEGTAASAPSPAPQAPASPAPAPSASKPEPTPTPAPAPTANKPAVVTPPVGDGNIVPAGPATRALARDLGVDLAQVPGSGPMGRVSRDDVKNYIRTVASGGGGGGGGVKVPPMPDFSKWGPIEEKPVESIRKRTAEHMSLCWSVIPHVTQFDQADVTDIEAFRKQQEAKGPKLTVTAFVLKAASIVLRQFPNCNASLDWENKKLIHKNYYHMGVAVDTERGLVVPVLRDVDKKSVFDIGKEMTEIAERARQGKLTPDDMQGGTFTISNLGGIGGTAFTPIVNWPQVAILGLSRSKMVPDWKDGQFIPRLAMPISFSYDHRVIDGADAARFARRLCELLENPMVMLLHA